MFTRCWRVNSRSNQLREVKNQLEKKCRSAVRLEEKPMRECIMGNILSNSYQAAGFLSHYVSGPLPYVRRHITVNKMLLQ